jgi:programmed cell death 6-interacting protein
MSAVQRVGPASSRRPARCQASVPFGQSRLIRLGRETHAIAQNWLAHLEAKQLHFEAVAQFRKSMDDLESGRYVPTLSSHMLGLIDDDRYGHELARLMQAKSATAKAVDVGRRGGVAAPVLRDARGFLDTLEKNFARAERDNDLIYHQDMPSASTLDPIAPASMVKSVTPPGLLDPQAVLAKGNEGVIFEELLSWGAREAISRLKQP